MPAHKKNKLFSTNTISLIGTLLFLIMGALYMYALHTGMAGQMLNQLRHLGMIGLLVGILILAILTIVPVPDEFVTVFLIEIYGPWLGFLASLIGGVLGAVVACYMCKWMFCSLLQNHPVKFLKVVDEWIQKHGILGLLVLRLIPIVPFHLLNYVCGFMKIKLWTFIWTTFIGIIPYNLALTGLFSGIRYGSMRWGIIGSSLCLMLVLLGWMSRRYWGKTAFRN